MNKPTTALPEPSRRDVARLAVGLGAAALCRPAGAQDGRDALITRPIPSSGEALPVVGLGTAYEFDEAGTERILAAGQVIAALLSGGGRLIDTASSYGDAESVLGDATAPGNVRDRLFIATKLESPDASELKRSLSRLRTAKLDLLQLHNVRSTSQSLALFRDWKAQGICRYIGITSTTHGDFSAVESVLRHERPDFVQVDYAIDDRTAEQTVLPLAADMKAAVLTAIPLGRNRLFQAVRGKPLPEWAAEFDAKSWAQFFLKYLIGNPAVTAVIPGTANAGHMADDVGAAHGRLPDATQRRRMVELIESL